MDIENISDEEFLKLTDEDLTESANNEIEEEETLPDLKDEEVEEEITDENESQTEEEILEENENESTEEDTPSEIDYKQRYEALMAPIKANGAEIQLEDTEDVRRLIQMGAGFNKKMADLKPNLKLIRMLKDNDILDEDRLNYLIDLDKKNPDAISKLLKDSEIDPLDLDTENTTYTPNTYTVDDKQVALEEALENIQNTPTYQTTLDILNTKLDDTSKQVLLEQPEIISVINEHVSLGIYDKIATEISKERMLGKLSGMSHLDAYRTVGDRLNIEGAFNNTNASNTQQTTTTDNPANTARKKAARTTKSNPVKQSAKEADLLRLSDDEFEQMMASKIY